MAGESFSVSQASVSRSGKNITVSFDIAAYGGYYCRVKVNGSVWRTSSASGSLEGTYSTTFEAPGAGSRTFSFVMEIQWRQGGTFEQWDTASRIASWSAATFTVVFNPNGGSVSTSSKTVTYGSAYGTLPTPTRTGFVFLGWYTAASGGTKVTAATTVSTAANHALYAHWQADTFSGVYDVNGGTIRQVDAVYVVSGGVRSEAARACAVIGGVVRQI